MTIKEESVANQYNGSVIQKELICGIGTFKLSFF